MLLLVQEADIRSNESPVLLHSGGAQDGRSRICIIIGAVTDEKGYELDAMDSTTTKESIMDTGCQDNLPAYSFGNRVLRSEATFPTAS